MHTEPDAEIIATTHNTARFFTENRQIAWVLLVATFVWGAFAYIDMPKRKDPDVPVNIAAAIGIWPGANADRIEQLVTRKMEEKIAENSKVTRIDSVSRNSLGVVIIEIDETIPDTSKELDDLQLKLNSIRDLPSGARPIEFIKDFGDTAALMLTVATPKVQGVNLSLRARSVRQAIEQLRATAPAATREGAATMVVCFPESISPRVPQRLRDMIMHAAAVQGVGRNLRPVDGAGFVGIDGVMPADDATVLGFLQRAIDQVAQRSDFHPDIWNPVLIRSPESTEARLAEVAGDRYSYRELDDFTDLIKRSLQTLPLVSKITRVGLLEERIFLEYSQERLAAYGLHTKLAEVLAARNTTIPGGVIEVQGKALSIDPSGEFKSEQEIGDVIVGASPGGLPVYLRDGVELIRGYDTPRYLNFFTRRDESGHWRHSRAITLAIQMRVGGQIGDFAVQVDTLLATLKHRLPEDLILARTSDQPLQVRESIDLFMKSLGEAIVLVILVAFIGFFEWRSAVLMALSIPLTLAMTFGMMRLLNLDLQSVSIPALIIALGLLVDDPVVAGDAIKRDLQAGHRPIIAAWLGPTKLATAILFATITNIVAYLPFLLLTGALGKFIYSLPVVLACSLVSSRIVSMTFVPLLGYYLLRPKRVAALSAHERRTRGFAGAYYRLAGLAIDHRWLAFGVSLLLLAGGLLVATNLKQQFFPKDLQYLSYVDLWLPEDSTLSATSEAAQRAEEIIREVAATYGAEHPGEDGKPVDVLQSITSFVGGGGPRFWFSVQPELYQLNYAQLLVQVRDKHDTSHLVAPLQQALSAAMPGVRVDVQQLESGKPIGIPVAIRLAGDDERPLRRLASQVADIIRATPGSDRVREDWGAESFSVKLKINPDRANISGISNQEVAISSIAGTSGLEVTTLREGEKRIPVVVRLRGEERAQLSQVQNMYVYSMTGTQKVPLAQISSIEYQMQTEKIRRRNQFRTITVSAFPVPGVLPSEVLNAAKPALAAFEATLPMGYRMEIGGEEAEQIKGFRELTIVMLVSVGSIFLALVFQFRNAIKPFIVFSAIPYGVAGALASLVVMGAPFGFMAFLGVVSLIGVIVSHVIVLFDFIEEMHAKGEPLRDALLDAGIVRLRPVMITVGATVFGLVPLALHGGPLWEPLCYTQIGGLLVATFITLLLVPVLYAIFVMDLKIVKWEEVAAPAAHAVPVGVETDTSP